MADSSSTNTIDSYHPFYLQASDNPGTSLVNISLTSQNYIQWSRAVKRALSAKNKLGLIAGTVRQPEPLSNLYPFWTRCNDMVVSWMLNSISDEIRDSVAYFGTAKEIWDDLLTRFAQGNVPRIFQLKKELTALHQGSMSITAYFTKCRTLTDELSDLSPLPKCNCPNNVKLVAYEQLNSLSQFLMGLNDVYTNIRGQILMMKPLPDLSQAYSLLLQEESQRDTHFPAVAPENMAMNVKFAGNKPKPTGNKKSENETCTYCNNVGHSKEKCFFLHGYPEWHRSFGKPKPKLRTTDAPKRAANVSTTPIDATEAFQPSLGQFTDA